MQTIDTTAETGRPALSWDVNTALAVIVLGALLVLAILGRAFKGFNVTAAVSAA